MDLSTFIKSTRNLTGELEGLVVRYDPSPYKLGQIPSEDQFLGPGPRVRVHAFGYGSDVDLCTVDVCFQSASCTKPRP